MHCFPIVIPYDDGWEATNSSLLCHGLSLIDKRRKKDKQVYHDDTTATIVNCSVVVGHTRSFGMVDDDDDDDDDRAISSSLSVMQFQVSRYTIRTTQS